MLDDQAYGMVVVDDVKNPSIAQVTLYDESSTLSTNTWYGGEIDHPILAEWIASQIPEDVRIERVDLPLAERLQDGFWPSIANNFASLEDFVSRGVAFCALVNEDPALVAMTNVVSDQESRMRCWCGIRRMRDTHTVSTSSGMTSFCSDEIFDLKW